MILKYNIEIDTAAINENIKRLTNQIYKLLPNREEGGDWKTPLTTIMEELAGMNRLLSELEEETYLSLLSKLEGLFVLEKENDFFLYRRTIFDCLNLMSILRKIYQKEGE